MSKTDKNGTVLGLVLAAVVGLAALAGCGSATGGTAVAAATTSSAAPETAAETTTGPPPSPSGYPMPKGQRFSMPAGVSGKKLVMRPGDLLVVPDVEYSVDMATRSGALVYAEDSADGLVFQAVRPGDAAVLTGPVPPAASCSLPCSGRAAPPTVTVQVIA